MMLGYVGPETVAPVLSALAAVCGFFLIGWRWILQGCRRVYRFVFRIPAPPDPVDDFRDSDDDNAAEQS